MSCADKTPSEIRMRPLQQNTAYPATLGLALPNDCAMLPTKRTMIKSNCGFARPSHSPVQFACNEAGAGASACTHTLSILAVLSFLQALSFRVYLNHNCRESRECQNLHHFDCFTSIKDNSKFRLLDNYLLVIIV